MNVGVGRRILLWGVGVLMALVAAVPSAGMLRCRNRPLLCQVVVSLLINPRLAPAKLIINLCLWSLAMSK